MLKIQFSIKLKDRFISFSFSIMIPKLFLSIALFLSLTATSLAVPGEIDVTFGSSGRALNPVGKISFDAGRAAGTQIVQFGANGDKPLPNAFVP